MKYFAITAEFPLGFYQGADSSRNIEPIPTPNRLFSALVSAAGESPLAETTEAGLAISAQSRDALKWLEHNPPQHITVPENIQSSHDVTAYKVLGLRADAKYGNPVAKNAIERSALAGRVVWYWDTPPTPAIAEHLSLLTAEVPYLGEAASPVTLQATTIESDDVNKECNYSLVPEEDSLTSLQHNSVAVPIPLPGRLESLEEAFAHSRSPVRPSMDKLIQNEYETYQPWPDAQIQDRWYAPVLIPPQTPDPWDEVFILEVEPSNPHTKWVPQAADITRWCVALHRTLVYAHGYGAPAVLTGKAARGLPRSANNTAIHIVHQTDQVNHDWQPGGSSAFVVAIPSDTSESDRAAVYLALQKSLKQTIWFNRNTRVRVTNISHVSGASFWSQPQPLTKRFWLTRPLSIADTRPIKTNFDGARWSLQDAALLSVGMVWRDYFGVSGRGESFYQELSHAASKAVKVLANQRVHGQDLPRYHHRSHANTLIAGYTALLDLNGLLSPEGFAAIGQSRHLGAGLLVPVDIPIAALSPEGIPLWLAP